MQVLFLSAKFTVSGCYQIASKKTNRFGGIAQFLRGNPRGPCVSAIGLSLFDFLAGSRLRNSSQGVRRRSACARPSAVSGRCKECSRLESIPRRLEGRSVSSALVLRCSHEIPCPRAKSDESMRTGAAEKLGRHNVFCLVTASLPPIALVWATKA